jgi:GTPase SAR1 family protein
MPLFSSCMMVNTATARPAPISTNSISSILATRHSCTANIWDFGGQYVYYATHQFFLSNRTVYILLTDTRRENGRFYDWLQMIEVLDTRSLMSG